MNIYIDYQPAMQVRIALRKHIDELKEVGSFKVLDDQEGFESLWDQIILDAEEALRLFEEAL